MKKFDVYLASAMLIIALVWFLFTNISVKSGDTLIVTKDNDTVGSYSLSEDGVYSVKDEDKTLLLFEIRNGSVNVLSASCPDKLCVHQKSISKNDELIVCLPNKIVLEINSYQKSDNGTDTIDAVTK